MTSSILITIYCLLFAAITYHRFHRGLFLLFLLLPTYLIRFNIGSLPTTLLEVMIWIIIIIWLLKEVQIINYESRKKLIFNLQSLIFNNKLFTSGIVLFLIASTISITTSSNFLPALGQYKAFYIEPFLIFLILITTKSPITNHQSQKQNPTPYTLYLIPLIFLALATSILAITQHFTGFFVPWAFWENGASYRVTGWYGFPNGVGLFLAPVLPLALYGVIQSWKQLKNNKKLKIKNSIFNLQSLIFIISLITIPCSLLAVLFAKSTGAIIGIAAGLGFLLLIYKKTRIPIMILGLVSIVSLVSLDSLAPIRAELFAQDRSGQIRISMWKEATQFLSDNPLSGAGLASYQEKIIPYHKQVNNENIEIFHHPHNIFLTMYVNLGLLGLIGFLLLLTWFFKTSLSHITYHISRNKNHQSPITNPSQTTLQLFLTTAMITLLTTGLVDSPYIKNDLSIFFWFLLALMYIQQSSSPALTTNSPTLKKL